MSVGHYTNKGFIEHKNNEDCPVCNGSMKTLASMENDSITAAARFVFVLALCGFVGLVCAWLR